MPNATAVPGADLYDRLDLWLASPEPAYAAWLNSLQLSNRSRVVYLSMWRKFVRWLKANHVRIDLCEAHHLSDFLNSNHLVREQRNRYTRLLERVYAHLTQLGLNIPNPGSMARSTGVARGENDRTHFLSRAQSEQLNSTLRILWSDHASPLATRADEDEEERSKEQEHGWIVIRDGVATALMSGVGLKVGELVLLPVNCTFDNDTLLIPGSGRKPERRAPLLPIAREALAVWSGFNSRIGFDSDRLLPASIGKRRHDQLTGSAAMHPSTLFKRVSGVLERAGIQGERATGQTLRNTYISALIEKGASDENIALYLGLQSQSAARLRAQHEAWSGDHAGLQPCE